jgi:hypothetical protein
MIMIQFFRLCSSILVVSLKFHLHSCEALLHKLKLLRFVAGDQELLVLPQHCPKAWAVFFAIFEADAFVLDDLRLGLG